MNKELNSLIVNNAKFWEGIKEGSRMHHELVDIYNSILPHPRGYKLTYKDSWCAAYVSAVMYTSGVSTFPFECGVYEMYNALYKQGCLIRGRLPQPAELVFFKESHVGICLGSNPEDGCIATIEGNSMDMCRTAYHYFTDPNINFFASPYPYTDGDIVKQVKAGWYGNDDIRIKALTENGYDPKYIQNLVNNSSRPEK